MTKYRLGYWLSSIALILTVVYLCTVLAILLFDKIPPGEPYQSLVSLITLVSVPVLIWLWVIIYASTEPEKHIFSLGSLALMIIFGTLTSLNRYVSLTVIPQALALGKTEGMSWFQPYGWPSIMAAMEVLAWGFYLGLAFFCLAPAFYEGKTERWIFWTLIISGVFCLAAALGQVLNSPLLNMLGIVAWGPGLIILLLLLMRWFRQLSNSQSVGKTKSSFPEF
jgi:hypothetical protein